MTNTRFKSLATVAAILGATVFGVAAPATAYADTLQATPLRVDFQTATSTGATGYLRDYGQAYTADRGYGWTTTTGTALDLTANGRQRNVNTDTRLDTFVQMQAKAGSGTTTTGSWQAAIDNGTYTVTIGVGDPSYFDSRNVINVEGVKVVDFTPTSANRYQVVTADVTVSDGFLNLTAAGGTNTKIDYLDVVAAGTPPPPSTGLTVTSPEDSLGLGSRMVFSTVQNNYRAGHNLTLTNSSSGSVNVTGLVFGGANPADFKVCTGQATTFTIAANSTAQVCVRYTPQVNAVTSGTQISQGTLTINSTDSATPTRLVTLGGLSTANYENNKEPSVQKIFDALGYTTNAGVTNKPVYNSISGASTAVADEILAPYFTRLNSTLPVKLIPLAQYSGKKSGNSASFGWYAKGSSTYNYLYAFPGGADGTNAGYGQNQILVPKTTTGSSGVNTTSFNPTGAFGISDNYTGYPSRSDDARNTAGWHNLRIYPAKDANGNVITGSYLIANDIGAPTNNSAKNWDYQDFAFLLVNATPDTSSSQPAAGAYNTTLASFTGAAGGISGTGFTSTQGTLTASKIAVTGGQLKITTTSDTNTSHTNALQLGVSAGTKFRVQSRLVGSFAAINAGAEQQGIYYGPSGNNYIKAEIDWNATDSSRHLTVWKEVNGAGSILYSIKLPNGDANTVDLRIDIDPSPQDTAHYNKDPQVSIYYALNASGNYIKLNTAEMTIPPSWITANTPAGVVTSHQEGGTAFVASFASFLIARI